MNWGYAVSRATTLLADKRLRELERVPERARVSRREPNSVRVSQSGSDRDRARVSQRK